MQQVKDQYSYIFLFVTFPSTSPDMTKLFHARSGSRFIEIQSNLFRKKKFYRTNQGSKFLGVSFRNRDNVRAVTQFRRERQPQHLKIDFCSRTDPSSFTSIAPVLLDQSNQTS